MLFDILKAAEARDGPGPAASTARSGPPMDRDVPDDDDDGWQGMKRQSSQPIINGASLEELLQNAENRLQQLRVAAIDTAFFPTESLLDTGDPSASASTMIPLGSSGHFCQDPEYELKYLSIVWDVLNNAAFQEELTLGEGAASLFIVSHFNAVADLATSIVAADTFARRFLVADGSESGGSSVDSIDERVSHVMSVAFLSAVKALAALPSSLALQSLLDRERRDKVRHNYAHGSGILGRPDDSRSPSTSVSAESLGQEPRPLSPTAPWGCPRLGELQRIRPHSQSHRTISLLTLQRRNEHELFAAAIPSLCGSGTLSAEEKGVLGRAIAFLLRRLTDYPLRRSELSPAVAGLVLENKRVAVLHFAPCVRAYIATLQQRPPDGSLQRFYTALTDELARLTQSTAPPPALKGTVLQLFCEALLAPGEERLCSDMGNPTPLAMIDPVTFGGGANPALACSPTPNRGPEVSPLLDATGFCLSAPLIRPVFEDFLRVLFADERPVDEAPLEVGDSALDSDEYDELMSTGRRGVLLLMQRSDAAVYWQTVIVAAYKTSLAPNGAPISSSPSSSTIFPGSTFGSTKTTRILSFSVGSINASPSSSDSEVAWLRPIRWAAAQLSKLPPSALSVTCALEALTSFSCWILPRLLDLPIALREAFMNEIDAALVAVSTFFCDRIRLLLNSDVVFAAFNGLLSVLEPFGAECFDYFQSQGPIRYDSSDARDHYNCRRFPFDVLRVDSEIVPALKAIYSSQRSLHRPGVAAFVDEMARISRRRRTGKEEDDIQTTTVPVTLASTAHSKPRHKHRGTGGGGGAPDDAPDTQVAAQHSLAVLLALKHDCSSTVTICFDTSTEATGVAAEAEGANGTSAQHETGNNAPNCRPVPWPAPTTSRPAEAPSPATPPRDSFGPPPAPHAAPLDLFADQSFFSPSPATITSSATVDLFAAWAT